MRRSDYREVGEVGKPSGRGPAVQERPCPVYLSVVSENSYLAGIVRHIVENDSRIRWRVLIREVHDEKGIGPSLADSEDATGSGAGEGSHVVLFEGKGDISGPLRLLAEFPGVKVILITPPVTPEEEIALRQGGVLYLLQKPIEETLLQRVLTQAIEHETSRWVAGGSHGTGPS
jgi:hypothetical protein